MSEFGESNGSTQASANDAPSKKLQQYIKLSDAMWKNQKYDEAIDSLIRRHNDEKEEYNVILTLKIAERCIQNKEDQKAIEILLAGIEKVKLAYAGHEKYEESLVCIFLILQDIEK